MKKRIKLNMKFLYHSLCEIAKQTKLETIHAFRI